MGERREMTDELRLKMAGWIGFDNNSTIDIPPKEYLPKERINPADKECKVEWCAVPNDLIGYYPTYSLRSFTKAENTAAQLLMKEARDDTENKTMLERFEKIREFVRSCVMNAKNNYDLGLMKEEPYKADSGKGMDKVQFGKIPDLYIWPLWNIINRLSGITSGESLGLKLPQQ
jgi:hypothetical protein